MRGSLGSFAVTGAVCAALAMGGCGGGGGSSSAKVGDCIDSSQQVVDCGSSDAAQKLVSSLDGPNAIACLEIGSPKEVKVKVGDGNFCAVSQ